MEKFNISFSGETLPDHDLATVKKRFAAYFHIDDPARTELFFSGREIVLRRNLDKDAAARVYVALRQLGTVPHIHNIEPEPPAQAMLMESARQATPAAPQRRRQPGAPNLFALRLPERTVTDDGIKERARSFSTAPLLAAGIVLLALLLVGLRFWAQSHAIADSGLGHIAIDPRRQPVVQAGDKLLLHDRAGRSTGDIPLAELGAAPAMAFDFFGNGDLLLRQQKPTATLPVWLRSAPAVSNETDGRLMRCRPGDGGCEQVLSVGENIAFAIDRRQDHIYLADADADTLIKTTADGVTLASQAMALSAPLSLLLEEGILYLIQGNADAVTVLKPDHREFGKTLATVSLSVAGASHSGHIFPAAIAWLDGRWWTIMRSRDGSTAGLYLFSPDWQFDSKVPLREGAIPAQLTRWTTKMLVSDRVNGQVYRFDAGARPEKAFSPASMLARLEEHRSQLGLSRALQVLILLLLFISGAGLLALGVLQSLRGKLYIPPLDSRERGFDINSDAIEWLDPAPETARRLRVAGFGIAVLAVVLPVGAFSAQFSISSMLAISLLLAGAGGYYMALQKALGCHLGLLEDELIVVDHTNTYRVGHGPTIQYFDNFVMIGDVIVYLGNPYLHHFASEPLQQKFQLVVQTGIRIDRTTLRVKLIQSRHPLLLGMVGLAGAIAAATLLVLLT